MDPLDPFGAWSWIASWSSPDELRRWLERTQWWTNPTTWSSRDGAPHRAFLELVEAVAGRFVGRQLAFDVEGTTVSLNLEDVRLEEHSEVGLVPNVDEAPEDREGAHWLERIASGELAREWWATVPGARESARWSAALGLPGAPLLAVETQHRERVVVLARLVWLGDLEVGDVAATADDVRLEFGAVPALVSGQLDLRVRASRDDVISWARRSWPDWSVRARASGLLAIRHASRRFTMLVRPIALGGSNVQIDLLGVSIFGHDILLPRRLVRSRRYAIPAPADGFEMIDARVDGDSVSFHLRHDGIRQPLRLDRIRAGLRDGLERFGAEALA